MVTGEVRLKTGSVVRLMYLSGWVTHLEGSDQMSPEHWQNEDWKESRDTRNASIILPTTIYNMHAINLD
jgi:hypothetical protein